MIARLYFDVGDGYNEDSSLEIYPLFSGRHHYAINIPAQYIPTGTKNLRYDPEEGFECEIANLKACVIDSRGERIPIGIRAINGKQKRRSHTITFDNPDPQILLETKDLSPEMDRLIIEGDIAFNHMPFMDE